MKKKTRHLDNLEKCNNSTKTEFFVENSRHQRLHFRIDTPESNSVALIVFLHGYGAHGNRSALKTFKNVFLKQSYAFLSLDFHGHGYSEGTRGLVGDYEDLIDDVASLLLALYGNFEKRKSFTPIKECKLPFYLVGHSMGGGATIMMSHALTDIDFAERICVQPDSITSYVAPFFKGSILFCPLVEVNVPPVANAVVDLLSFLFPLYSIPSWIFDENNYNHLIWSETAYIDYIKKDGYPNNRRGLSYGGNIRFKTLATLIHFSKEIQKILRDTTFDFVVFHDPDDVTCKFDGSLKLESISRSSCKELISCAGLKHDIIANDSNLSSEKSVDWLLSRRGEHLAVYQKKI